MVRKFITAAIFATCFLQSTTGGAQSSIQSVDSAFSQIGASSFDASFSSSMNPVQRNVFAILYARENGRLSGATTGEELIARMRQIGLQVVLDQSAIDDSFTTDDAFEIPKLNLQNSDVLATALSPHNATLALVGNRLSIISRDVAYDPEYFTNLVYDVSHLADDADWFLGEIKSSIDPDSWDDTNGDGVAMIRVSNGRKLMTIAQTVNIHLQIQEHMRGLVRLQGSRKFRPSMTTGSRIVGPTQAETDRDFRSRYSRPRLSAGGVF